MSAGPCSLADTGSNLAIPLIVATAVLLIGVGLLVAHRRKLRRSAKVTGATLILALALITIPLAGAPTPASADTTTCQAGTAPASSLTTAPMTTTPSTAPTTTPSTTPTPTPTPTVAPVACPAGGDLSTLPSGDTIVWVPIIAPDPRTTSGTTDGQTVIAWTNNISGYTWHIARPSDGTTSAECSGMPGPGCVAYPTVLTSTEYAWAADASEWVATGVAAEDNGCTSSGGNS